MLGWCTVCHTGPRSCCWPRRIPSRGGLARAEPGAHIRSSTGRPDDRPATGASAAHHLVIGPQAALWQAAHRLFGSPQVARRPPGNLRTTEQAVRCLPQRGLGPDDEVVGGRRAGGGAVVRTAGGTADVGAGFCPRETAAGGDPARPAAGSWPRMADSAPTQHPWCARVASESVRAVSEADHTRTYVRHRQECPLAADTAPAGAATARATKGHVDVPVAGAVVHDDLADRHVLDEAEGGGHVLE